MKFGFVENVVGLWCFSRHKNIMLRFSRININVSCSCPSDVFLLDRKNMVKLRINDSFCFLGAGISNHNNMNLKIKIPRNIMKDEFS